MKKECADIGKERKLKQRQRDIERRLRDKAKHNSDCKEWRRKNKIKCNEKRRLNTLSKKNYDNMNDLELLSAVVSEIKTKIYLKNWNKNNATRVKKYRKTYENNVRLHPEKYREKNKELRKKQKHEWHKKHKDEQNRLSAIRIRNRKTIDINYRISCNLRSRLNSAITRNHKQGSAVKDLGCTIEEFKQYIESKFQQGMTWENYGPYTWHIDHIVPLSWFDLSDRNQLLLACNYTNLQPLWAEDNWSKNKLTNL